MKKQLLIGLIGLLSLSACTKLVTPEREPFPEIPTPDAISFALPHGTVTQADTENTWFSNGIETNFIEYPAETTQDGVLIDYGTMHIDGLLNQTVEDLINQKIDDKINDFKKYAKFDNLPVYPGFYAAYPKDKRTIKSINISCYPYFNANHILSVRFYASILINAKDDYKDFSIMDAMNFDLNTGDELTLSDLFINGSDFESRLNEAILLKSQSMTDPIKDELQGWIDSYQYVGGFKGIRGDLKFFIIDNRINLLFNEHYPEFINDFSTVSMEFKMQGFKDILAFGQRFVHNDQSLFTNPSTLKTKNYLYQTHTDVLNEIIDGHTLHSRIYYDDEFPEKYKNMRATILSHERNILLELIKTHTAVYYEFSASLDGPYLNVRSSIYADGEVVRGVRQTYKADGTLLTMKDVFIDGFDYRSFIKDQIAQIISDSEYQEDYDLDEVYEALAPTLSVHSFLGEYAISFTNEFVFDFSQDEGDFSITLYLKKYQDILKITPWGQ